MVRACRRERGQPVERYRVRRRFIARPPDYVLNINNITYNPVAGTVPEPGTLAMLGSGVMAAVSGLRRRFAG